ncbi:MAG: dihydropyrimidinase, partial [Candidatus Bipolaricaulota bacterium]|nr:dihydropyrimidinase [Candidatus Bipolaricaulota bacterium]
GLYPQKGTLQPESDADLVIFDPALQHTISRETQHSNATYTLYEGRTCLGKPIFSMQRGAVLLEDGTLHIPPGNGKFLQTNTKDGTGAFFNR